VRAANIGARTMTYRHLIIREDGPTLWVTMNRPERLNALNAKLVEELREFFVGLYWRHEIRVVVLGGAGRGFCAGLDLKERPATNTKPTVSNGLVSQRKISEIVIAMRRCSQPIVAMVNGPASCGGFALALASDIRIATPTTRMNAAFIRIGLSACDIGVSYFLPRMIGASAASEYMLTGRFIDGERGHELGLISKVVSEDKLQDEARGFVKDLLHATPLGLRLTKEALNHAIDAQSLEAAIAMEVRNQVLCAQGEDFREGISAFLEKRAGLFVKRCSWLQPSKGALVCVFAQRKAAVPIYRGDRERNRLNANASGRSGSYPCWRFVRGETGLWSTEETKHEKTDRFDFCLKPAGRNGGDCRRGRRRTCRRRWRGHRSAWWSPSPLLVASPSSPLLVRPRSCGTEGPGFIARPFLFALRASQIRIDAAISPR
jgi:enoyl-CoA hydratase/carnithine racemase